MPTLTSVTKHFITSQEGFTTTTAGSVASGAATVTLNSVSGYTNGDQVAFAIDPTDVTKKQVFTGTIDTSGVQVTNVVWTEGTNQTHAAGATVVDYTTATHQAAMVKGVKVSLDQDGTLKADSVTADNIDFTTLAFGNYSSSEVDTGFKWTDGKTIYKRTITGTVTAASSTRNVATRSDITGIETIVDVSGYMVYDDAAKQFPYGSVQTDASGGVVAKSIGLLVTTTDVTVITISDATRTSAPYALTIQYTKV